MMTIDVENKGTSGWMKTPNVNHIRMFQQIKYQENSMYLQLYNN